MPGPRRRVAEDVVEGPPLVGPNRAPGEAVQLLEHVEHAVLGHRSLDAVGEVSQPLRLLEVELADDLEPRCSHRLHALTVVVGTEVPASVGRVVHVVLGVRVLQKQLVYAPAFRLVERAVAPLAGTPAPGSSG